MRNTLATIAIVDDDDSVRDALRHLLRAADFEPLTFASAEEFLSARDAEQVDCLIADINLPGMSGVALVEALCATGRSIPTVLITARDDPNTLELIRRTGALPHLRKPFSDVELFAAIARLLSR
jgi:FixJ family two-component response regulator